jgi:integration host factor subunit beta
MIKSQLIRRITSQNPHLYERDIEKVVNAIFDEMVEALRRGERIELRGFGVFSAKLRGARTGRNRSQRELILSSRRERRCARGLIKACRQPDHATQLASQISSAGLGPPSQICTYFSKE